MKSYFDISQLNSIRFAKQAEWDSFGNHKTPSNTLSYQEDGLNNKNFYQLFQLSDAVRIQFKSNFDNHQVDLYNCDGDTHSFNVLKRTQNLNNKDFRTCTIRPFGLQTIMFFGQGYIVNYDTGFIVGTYDLKNKVPSWMKKGAVITYINGNYTEETTVIDLIWLEDVELYGIITTIQPPQVETNGTVKSLYNTEDYEIYEFDIDFFHFREGKYQLEIVASHVDYETVTFLSERINLKTKHENTHLIICEDSANNQINYSWGIQHLMRVPFENQLEFNPSGENGVHKTDSNAYLLNSTQYENYSADFSPLPTSMTIKLGMNLSLSKLQIDSRSYVSEQKIEVEKLESTNLYKAKAKLLLTSSEFIVRDESYRSFDSSEITLLETVNEGEMLNTGIITLLSVD